MTDLLDPDMLALLDENPLLDETKKWYVHPGTGERFVRVSGGLSCVPKEGLTPWAAGLSARAAFVELPRVVAASRRRGCGKTNARCPHPYHERCDGCPCGECRDCVEKILRNQHFVEKTRRADEGTRIHRAIREWTTNDGRWPAIDDDIASYIKAFRRFLADYGLTHESWEAAEVTVINRTHEWGGTLDANIRIRWGITEKADDFCARVGHIGRDVVPIVDYKSREKQDGRLFGDNALQVSAYRRGEAVLLRDGTELDPMEATVGAVLQLRPEVDTGSDEEDAGAGYIFRPVVTDDESYEVFLATLQTYRWWMVNERLAVSSRTFPLPEQYKRDKANRKARERRAAAKAAAAVKPADEFPVNSAPPADAAAKAEPVKRAARSTRPRQPTSANGDRPLASRILGVSPDLARDKRPGYGLTDDDIPF